jgi:hypothetical protein
LATHTVAAGYSRSLPVGGDYPWQAFFNTPANVCVGLPSLINIRRKRNDSEEICRRRHRSWLPLRL